MADSMDKRSFTCCRCSIAAYFKSQAHAVLDGWEQDDTGKWLCGLCSEKAHN